jgi:7-cyano-7-deazaguanine synthase
MSSKCILLLSGGLDSGSLLFWAKHQKLEILPLFVNYGQISYPGEWQSVQYLLKSLGESPISPLSIPEIATLGAGTLVGKANKTPVDQYFPSRNILLLTLAAMYAYQKSASIIMIGLIADTTSILPDCSPEFVNRAEELFQVEYPNLKISAPFIGRSKLEIVQEAMSYGLEPETTFCCNTLSDHHCWYCPSCIDRIHVMEAIGKFRAN